LLLLNFPLSQAWHVVAPGVLDVPVGQSSHALLGGSLPTVPAGHALKPEGAEASILDPSGTMTAVDPSPATTCPFATAMHVVAFGSGWYSSTPHASHVIVPEEAANVPGMHGKHDAWFFKF
jgi:hypothetical protein